jgi:hypothetical protein
VSTETLIRISILELFSIFKYPFDLKLLPKNGVYFFYEKGEDSEHGDGISRPRILRIGTHKENNFRSRISEHFLLNESKMKFTKTNPKPSDRSIFRKNIGRALLNKQRDLDYLKVWEIDYTSNANRANHSHHRSIQKERDIVASSNIPIVFPYPKSAIFTIGIQNLEDKEVV